MQSGAHFDDDAGKQAEVSQNSVGEAAVSGYLMSARKQKLVRCRAVESPLDSNPGSNFAFAS